MAERSFGIIFGAVTLGVIVGGAALMFGPPLYVRTMERIQFQNAPKLLVGYSYVVCTTEFAAKMIQQHNQENNDGMTTNERISFFDCQRAPTAEVQVTNEKNGIIQAKAQTESGRYANFYFLHLK